MQTKTKHTVMRAFGAALSACLLLGQTILLPSSAATFTGADITTCDYYYKVGETIDTKTNCNLTCEKIGVPANAKVEQVWLNVSGEAGKHILPAIGYTADGYNEDNWYSDSFNLAEATGTIVFDIPAEYPLPNEFLFQFWWGEVDSITINSVGIKTNGSASGPSIGVATRKGDGNNDQVVSIADAVALASFLTKGTALAAPANVDLDRDNRLTAMDLTLLKRGILDGSLTQVSTEETAMEFVKNIKLGWSLGNTLDATGKANNQSPYTYETGWGNPYTTKEMITAIKNAGFNTVRVPVSWGQKMGGAPDYKVNDDWMKRVKEVVDYVIDNGMYCILNTHHDTDWQVPRNDRLSGEQAQLKALWTQISTTFAGYDNHLIFETLNEPRLVGDANEWNGGNAEARSCVNALNATAIAAIRATGGNNKTRFLMVPPYCASPIDSTINDYVLPDDNHLIVSIHAYTPYEFALKIDGTGSWNESSGSYDIIQNFERLKSKFISRGIPVIIGEFGALSKNNDGDRAKWVQYYISKADSYGIPCVWWDNGAFSGEGELFGLLNRNACTIAYPGIMEAMVRGASNR